MDEVVTSSKGVVANQDTRLLMHNLREDEGILNKGNWKPNS